MSMSSALSRRVSIGGILDIVSGGLPSYPAPTVGQQVAIANPKLDNRKPVELTAPLPLAQLSECFSRNYAEELPTFGDVIEQRDDLGIIVRVIERPRNLMLRGWKMCPFHVMQQARRAIESVFI
jgi:hypothetical protein